MTLRSGRALEDVSKKINIPFAEALEQMPLYAKFMKDLISKKEVGEKKKPFNWAMSVVLSYKAICLPK
ncbi:hypothetical protein PIB30_059745 [Stylosanthes scabra]|uniref:Uncharacterized protein n=1 Tax=Stylosanthes scabra TaxID=79078 RepID=A0ABU6WIM8_9FABA|nr:hypothetical protein [Stylosanthes scabra]